MFAQKIDACYNDPSAADKTFVAHLHIVMAIGLVLGTPLPGSHQDQVLQKLQESKVDRAETLFRNAMTFNDPTAGLENKGFGSIQVLILMSVYMLTRTRRSAAYTLHGTLSGPFLGSTWY